MSDLIDSPKASSPAIEDVKQSEKQPEQPMHSTKKDMHESVQGERRSMSSMKAQADAPDIKSRKSEPLISPHLSIPLPSTYLDPAGKCILNLRKHGVLYRAVGSKLRKAYRKQYLQLGLDTIGVFDYEAGKLTCSTIQVVSQKCRVEINSKSSSNLKFTLFYAEGGHREEVIQFKAASQTERDDWLKAFQQSINDEPINFPIQISQEEFLQLTSALSEAKTPKYLWARPPELQWEKVSASEKFHISPTGSPLSASAKASSFNINENADTSKTVGEEETPAKAPEEGSGDTPPAAKMEAEETRQPDVVSPSVLDDNSLTSSQTISAHNVQDPVDSATQVVQSEVGEVTSSSRASTGDSSESGKRSSTSSQKQVPKPPTLTYNLRRFGVHVLSSFFQPEVLSARESSPYEVVLALKPLDAQKNALDRPQGERQTPVVNLVTEQLQQGGFTVSRSEVASAPLWKRLHGDDDTNTKDYKPDAILLKLSLATSELLREAEVQRLRKRLKEMSTSGEYYEEFTSTRRRLFLGFDDEGNMLETFLVPEERQQLNMGRLHSLPAGAVAAALTPESKSNNTALLLKYLEKKGILLAKYSVHDYSQNPIGTSLREHWLRRKLFAPTPYLDVKKYFGDQVAVFIDWATYHTTALSFPAILGVWVTLKSDTKMAHILELLFPVTVIVWTSLYIYFWKRRAAANRYKWNLVSPSLEGVTELEIEEARLQIEGNGARHFKPPFITQQLPKYLATALIFFSLSTLNVGLIGLATYFKNSPPYNEGMLKFVPLGGQALYIEVASLIFDKVARWNVEWMNLRSHEDYVNQYIIRRIFFLFPTKCLPLWYTAFFLKDVPMLRDQLLSMVLTAQIIEIAGQTVFAHIKHCAVTFNSTYQRRQLSTLAESQFHLKKLDLTAKYADKVLQFGFLTMWAAAFPLGFALNFIANLLDVRALPYALLYTFRRPLASKCSGIGMWYGVILVSSVIAIINNSAYILLTAKHLDNVWDSLGVDRTLTVFGVEHLLLLLHFVVVAYIPHVPKNVRNLIAHDIALRRVMMRKFVAQKWVQMKTILGMSSPRGQRPRGASQE